MSQAEDGPTWASIREAFEKAIELPHAEREEFLGSLRLEAPALARRVTELLAAAIGPGLQPDRSGPMELIARELSVPVLDEQMFLDILKQ